MPAYCEVALPVPLDRTFTYAFDEDNVNQDVRRGARVIVPFRNEKMVGVVLEVHSRAPEEFAAKPIEKLMDFEPLLSEQLLELAQWIAQYYLAPLGEVLRGMLPLAAEMKYSFQYHITDRGRDVLAGSFDGDRGHPGELRTKRLRPEEQAVENHVLMLLAEGKPVKVGTLKNPSGISHALLSGMIRKKWIVRENMAVQKDANRMERFAVLVPEARLPTLTVKQQAILAELAASNGETRVAALVSKGLPTATLQTLVKRGLVAVEERALDFRMGGVGHVNPQHALNEAQMEALASISTAEGFQTFLLHGVTGSGKTAVYLAAMQRVLDRGMGAILLVPEIGLTPAAAAQLDSIFGDRVALLHSGLTPMERSEQWHRIRTGDAPIVVGTRSAIFAPVPNLGLILVDEEHDQSYKQEETPRYNARDVAVVRAKLSNAPVVLGSATPSLESWQNSETGKYKRITMAKRVKDRPLPGVELVDMRMEFQQTGHDQIFSRLLIQETQAALDRGEQAMILLNRRGYSFVAMCRSCGKKLECINCAISLTHHKPVDSEEGMATAGQRLECHLLRLSKDGSEALPGLR